MKVLLDTCTFLWITLSSEKLSQEALKVYENQQNSIYLSIVSYWEIALKHQLGRLPLSHPPKDYIMPAMRMHDIALLPLDTHSVDTLGILPNYHNDPFDKMLICQALAHDMIILTPDKHIHQYSSARVHW